MASYRSHSSIDKSKINAYFFGSPNIIFRPIYLLLETNIVFLVLRKMIMIYMIAETTNN